MTEHTTDAVGSDETHADPTAGTPPQPASTHDADQAGGYTVFGRITSGLDVVTAVADAGVQGGGPDGPPATGVTIQGVETQ